MTIHSVKGIEYDTVFVVGLEEGIFPHMNSLMSNSDVEEERRLCYVAITTAKKNLYLLNARRRVLFGKDCINPPSRFLKEIDKDLITTNYKEEPKPITKESVLKDTDTNYEIGDYVVHENFGTGKVIEVTNSLVTVAFPHPYGIKKLMKNHKSLSKIV